MPADGALKPAQSKEPNVNIAQKNDIGADNPVKNENKETTIDKKQRTERRRCRRKNSAFGRESFEAGSEASGDIIDVDINEENAIATTFYKKHQRRHRSTERLENLLEADCRDTQGGAAQPPTLYLPQLSFSNRATTPSSDKTNVPTDLEAGELLRADGDVANEMIKMDSELQGGLIPVQSTHRKQRLWICFKGCSLIIVILLVAGLIVMAKEEMETPSPFADTYPPMALEDLTYTCTPEFITADGKHMCERACRNAEECCLLSVDDLHAGCRDIRNATQEVSLCEEYKEACTV
eukprot:CAMPEP_0185738722 /NCGR_PEP_ID=MMETSP1171-20130828/33729_1 /TAXON_ID=374046 /ORGANISM="Helicotheca tamensis, Strain CCMP826" /LENGTH=293 /DNA_ID=CAMNT_0028410061 /DNA_START=117 /DNA_END=994 /DNA_ORIENTATION=-